MSDKNKQCVCKICDPANNPVIDNIDRIMVDKIKEVGWFMLNILPREDDPEDDDMIPWSFTVGVWHTHRQPDVIIFGNPNTAHGLAHAYIEEIKLGRTWEAGYQPDGIIQTPDFGAHLLHLGGLNMHMDEAILQMKLGMIDEELVKRKFQYFEDHMGTANGFYREPYPVFQIVWPDDENRFPWDEDWEFPYDQPVLCDEQVITDQ